MRSSLTNAVAVFFSFLFSQSLFSQNISGVINSYAKISAIDTCSGQLTVSSTTGFQPGGAVILIQMQGATMSSGNNSDFGKIQNINSCGLFEENEVVSVSPPSTIFLKYKLVNKYDVGNGAVQLVSFPKYQHATIADTLFSKKWDGLTGGILAISAQKLTFQAPIVANGQGFRGGLATTISGNNCSWAIAQDEFTYGPNNWRGALKGEGIVPFFNDKEAGKGAQANGGGGGNDHNAGGGGGANTKPGGKGGKNDEPANFGCKGNHPGLGGLALTGSAARLFLGGGGGAGHGNNNVNGSGGHGGGIVIVLADTLDGQDATVFANGLDGGASNGDGAGGGGAGGSVFLQYKTALANPSIIANGGAGGSNDATSQDRCQGPGGGGAAGQVYCNFGIDPLNGGLNNYSLDGGQPGIVLNSTAGCDGSSNGATAGTTGVFTKISAEIPASAIKLEPLTVNQNPLAQTACVGENPVLSVGAEGNTFTYQWQVDTGNGWMDIPVLSNDFSGANGAELTILNAKIAQNGHKFRCKLHPTACSTTDVFTDGATLSVLQKPNVAFVFSVNNNLLATFTNLSLNAPNLLWDFGDSSPTSTLANPGHTYSMPGNYTVSLTGWNGCDTVVFTQIIVVEIAPTAGFLVENPVFGCGNSVEVQFENTSSGNISGQNWQFPGGNPATSTMASPIITYSSSGSYVAKLTVTGATGATNTVSQNFDVELAAFPTANFTTSISGQVVTFTNTSAGGSTYFWDFGDSQTSTDFNVTHSFPQGGTWVVTLVVQNACGASVFQKTINLQWSATDDFSKKHGLRVFPNPTDGPVFVEIKEVAASGFSLQLIDLQGLIIFEKEILGENAALDLGGFPSGAYFLKITGTDGQVVRRLVKI